MGTNKKLCCNDLLARRYKLQPVMDSIYIAEGQNLKFGSVVDCNGFLCGSTHLEPYAILYEDCDTTNGAQEANVLIMGEFNIEKLVFGADATGDVLDKIVFYAKKNGIIIRPYDYAPSFTPPEVSSIENVIPEGTSQTNPLINAEEAQRMIDASIHEVTLDPSEVALGNVHLLDEVTSFAADAKILVDSETNGPGAMSADNLLAVTAQNALAGNVAPAFDPTRTNSNPYKVGEVVIYEGKAYSFKVSHYGAWNASDVTTANLSPIQYIFLSSSNIANYNDCDNYPENSAVRCSNSSVVSQVSNLPKTDQFAIFTYSAGGLLYQLFFGSTTNELYFRRKWGSWASWSKLMDSANAINLIGSIDSTKAQSAPYNDLNTAPINEIIMYISSYSYVSNKPVNESFQAVTIGASNGVKIQFVTTLSRKIYVRSYWNPNWSNWISLDENENLALSFAPDFSSLTNYAAGDIICHEGRIKKAFKPISAGGSYTAADWENVNLENYKRTYIIAENVAYYNDIDNYPAESVVSCLNSSLLSQISHLPENSQFTCYSFKGGSNAVSMQLFISANTNELYFRRKWASWTSWRKFAFVGETEPDTPNPLFAFDNIVAVGDSLTWCQVYTGVNTSRQAKKLWCDMLAYSCDATAQTIAVAGDTAKTSWPRVDSNLNAKDNAVIIVYLGTNGGLTDTLDADAPVADPYTDWADTNTGCYAKIVAKAQSLGYKVLLIKPWAGGGGDLDTTNDVIDQIGTRFGCCVVGPFKTTESKYHYYPDLSGTNTLHYNDLGYAWFATALPYYVSRAENAQLKYIIPS